MSLAEHSLLEALEARGVTAVPQHSIQLPSGPRIRVDVAVPSARLAIEIDHPTWHATAESLQRDHARDSGLALLGWERLRFTTDDVERRLGACVATALILVARRHDSLAENHRQSSATTVPLTSERALDISRPRAPDLPSSGRGSPA